MANLLFYTQSATGLKCLISYSIAASKRAMIAAVGRQLYRFHTILGLMGTLMGTLWAQAY
jgi:hypothetical protein